MIPAAIAPKYFTIEEIESLDSTRVPHHVAIMMDGNRRWAKKSAQKILDGHLRGADVAPDILKAAKELGIKVMTLYTFSTENWNRSKDEVATLMWVLATCIRKNIPEMIEQGIRFDTIGETSLFPDSVRSAIHDAKEATQHCEDLHAVYAMNYGSRDELKRAIQKIGVDVQHGDLQPEDINEETIAKYLDTAKYPDPDLLIRTSGEHRMSNFLLWQVSYAEICFTDTLWPDFTPQTLLQAIRTYQKRERRLGV